MTLKANNEHSLEHQLKIVGISLLAVISGLLLWLFYLLELSALLVVTLFTVLLPLLIFFYGVFTKKLLRHFIA